MNESAPFGTFFFKSRLHFGRVMTPKQEVTKVVPHCETGNDKGTAGVDNWSPEYSRHPLSCEIVFPLPHKLFL